MKMEKELNRNKADQKSILGQVRKELQNSIRVREGFSPKTRQGTRFGLNWTGNGGCVSLPGTHSGKDARR